MPEKPQSQESPRAEKLVEGEKSPSQMKETANGVSVVNTSSTHPDAYQEPPKTPEEVEKPNIIEEKAKPKIEKEETREEFKKKMEGFGF